MAPTAKNPANRRKVIQIAATCDGTDDPDPVIVALCDDGSIWQKWLSQTDWHEISPVPQD